MSIGLLDNKKVNKICVYLQAVGERLKFSENIIASSIIFYFRFIRDGPKNTFEDYILGTACLMLASKAHDEDRKIRDILNCCELISKGRVIEELTEEYWKKKDKIVECEQVLLRTLAFDVECTHSFPFMLNYAHSLHIPAEVVQVSWALLVDSYSTDIVMKYKPSLLAVSSIYIALQFVPNSIVLPRVHGGWWSIFDCKTEEVKDCSLDLLSIYETINSNNTTHS
ncbi:hypothetical protein WA158_004063 [Blastocystis sp. Blastoise]